MVLTLALAVAAGVLAGCSSGGEPQASSATGAAVFADAGCGDCHALSAAGSTGTAGPSLDALKPAADRVERQVTSGGRGMPAFGGTLTDDEIADVAAYVEESSCVEPRLRRRGVRARRHEARGLRGEQCVLRAGVRQPRVRRGAEARPCGLRREDPERPHGRRLPPDRALPGRGRARPLRRRGRAGLRGRHGRVLVRLLPRHPRACLRGRLGGGATRGVAAAVLERPGAHERLRRVPVRPRARARADDLHELRHAALARDLRRALHRLGPDVVHRRRIHGEPPDLVRDALQVAAGRRPPLPLPDRRREAQALLLPHGHVAHPRRRRRRLAADGRLVPQGRGGLDGDVLPVARAGCVRPFTSESVARSSASARWPGT